MVLDAADHDTWSVGSFFTNPVVRPRNSTGAERRAGNIAGAVPNYPGSGRGETGRGLAGGAGRLRQGVSRPEDAPARLSTKHALALTNRGGATTGDVVSLARTVRDGVRTTFGIDLTPEPILIGCTF